MSPQASSSPYNMPGSSYRIPTTLGTLAVMPDTRSVGDRKWSLPHHTIGPKGQVLCSRRPIVRSTPRSAVSWYQLAYFRVRRSTAEWYWMRAPLPIGVVCSECLCPFGCRCVVVVATRQLAGGQRGSLCLSALSKNGES